MRFRYLYAYSFVTLGKQDWNFMSDLDAIVTQVFKTKYFSKVDFWGSNV